MTWRLDRLTRDARALDAAVRAETARPLPDSLRIMELKRRKLATRDEIAMLDAGLISRN
ncbi:YdcH family protein [Phenylobacterium sp.]|jgi:hypothetical protein|uniref:YdcH family protein n=1 Tax=Phenylobacterium sp. TaxID=1871053 RepID=UPI002F921AFB